MTPTNDDVRAAIITRTATGSLAGRSAGRASTDAVRTPAQQPAPTAQPLTTPSGKSEVATGDDSAAATPGNLQTDTLFARQIDMDGANNHIKFAHPTTRVYTIGIDGSQSLMAFANSDTAFYTVMI